MTLQASGAISFSDLQTEYGDTGPISASELYRNGSLVPTNIVSVGTWGPYLHTIPFNNEVVWNYDGNGNTSWYYRAHSTERVALGSGNPNQSQVILSNNGLYQYQCGPNVPPDRSAGNGTNYASYQIRARTYANDSVNTDVPASGTITLSDFYGGRGS